MTGFDFYPANILKKWHIVTAQPSRVKYMPDLAKWR